MAETEEEQEGLPIWLSLLVIVLAIGAGGGLLYWLLTAPRADSEVVIAPPAETRPQPFGMRPNRRPGMAISVAANDITAVGKDNWAVNSGKGQLRVFVRDNNSLYRFAYLTPDYATPEQFRLNMLARQVVRDEAVAQKIGATPEQIEKLKPHVMPIGMMLSQADREQIIGLWTQWQSAADAAKTDAKDKLLAALKDVADRALPATQAAIAERTAAVKAILSAEQIDKGN